MTPQDLDALSAFLRARSGLALAGDRRRLVEARLGPLVRRNGLADLSALIAALRAPADERLTDLVVEAMTTRETSFFRDRATFDAFRDLIVPDLVRSRGAGRTIRIWCAAASSGQEPYSLSMMVRDDTRLEHWRTDILATDIAQGAVARGRAGTYSQFEVQRGLPVRLLVRHFRRAGDDWRLDDTVRRLVRWRTSNLLDSFAALGRFDLVFCRNVLADFDSVTRSDVLARLADTIEPDGYLVLGAAETATAVSDRFEPVPGHRGLFRRRVVACAPVTGIRGARLALAAPPSG